MPRIARPVILRAFRRVAAIWLQVCCNSTIGKKLEPTRTYLFPKSRNGTPRALLYLLTIQPSAAPRHVKKVLDLGNRQAL